MSILLVEIDEVGFDCLEVGHPVVLLQVALLQASQLLLVLGTKLLLQLVDDAAVGLLDDLAVLPFALFLLF